MAGEITSRNAQESPIHSTSAGRGVDPAALFLQSGGLYNGEKIAPIPQTNAAGLVESVENLAESGAIALQNRNRTAGSSQGNVRSRPVSGRSSAAEMRDTTSSTADADEPDAVVKRISTLLDAFDGGGGGGGMGGGGHGGGDAGQQQRQHAQSQQAVGSMGSASSKQSAVLVDRLNAIRDKALDILAAQPGINQGQLLESIIDAVREALGELSFDHVQQMTALEVARSHFGGADDIFSSALNSLQQDYERFDVGGFLSKAVRSTFDTINAAKAARATMETDPTATRAYQRQQFRENVKALGNIIESLERTHPKMPMQAAISDYMAIAGHEISNSDGINIDKQFLHSLLSELAALKALNSVYDITLELLDKTNLQENDQFTASVMLRPILELVAATKPVDANAIRENSLAVLPKNMDHDDMFLFTNNLADAHGRLPDAIFPGASYEEQRAAQQVQATAVLNWRHDLAEDENRALYGPSPKSQAAA
ncbi:hypothetical protein [Pseudochelatococcus sp. G4_1912]|uniref:hypothetical protein n=1 Tax=Pseudochelatococcus sp. G4_1912 TaxID=3114288 RepID=UPI0039C5DB44